MFQRFAVHIRRGPLSPPSGPARAIQNVPSAQRTMWAGFAALGRSRLNSRKHNWTAPVELTAVQPSPWLYRESTAPLRKHAETNRERRALPIQPKKKPHESDSKLQTKQTNSKGDQQRRGGDGDKRLPHLG